MVWLLNDGKAGHFNQTRGIVSALGEWATVEEETISIRLRVGFWKWFLDTWARQCSLRPLCLLHLAYKVGEPPSSGSPDLILSAGGNTRHANAWLAKRWSCRNLFCGNLRGMLKKDYDGVLSYDESREGEKGWIVSPTPVAIRAEEVNARGEVWRESREGLEYAELWTLLIGGDGSGYSWRESDFERLIQRMKEQPCRWVIVNSRRSDVALCETLRSELQTANLEACCLVSGPKDIEYREALGVAARIWVTEDSHMMISEAIASGRPVQTLQPERFATAPINLRFLKYYERRRWISRHSLSKEISFPKGELMTGGLIEELGEKLKNWWRGSSI